MSYCRNLIEQKEPLNLSEIKDLKGWLGAIKQDVADFGATEEDIDLVAKIEAKIKEAENGNAL